ncbi:MAG: hypothetical protein NC399_09705 [Muribaculum sp.]|nr:hypothetical protein [Muribaculum sp.]
MSILGVNGALAGVYQYAGKAQKTGESVSFASLAATKAAGKVTKQDNISEMSLKDMWQTRFPGAYYHTMDAFKIPQGEWERNDFPFENFFQNNTDVSVVNWNASGVNPAMDSSEVQSRLNSTLGKKSIVVPPALEEKMKNNPKLAQSIMAKIENFIVTDEAKTPNTICSYLIVLDENGEIAHSRISRGGNGFVGPTEAQQRQFKAEQEAKRKRHEEYARLNEEAALKRRLTEQETDRRYYQRKAVSAAAYERSILEKNS